MHGPWLRVAFHVTRAASILQHSGRRPKNPAGRTVRAGRGGTPGGYLTSTRIDLARASWRFGRTTSRTPFRCAALIPA